MNLRFANLKKNSEKNSLRSLRSNEVLKKELKHTNDSQNSFRQSTFFRH